MLPRVTSAESWQLVRAEDFTLITTLRPNEAVAWAQDFSQFTAAIGRFINVDRAQLPKLTVIVFRRQKDFLPFRPQGNSGRPEEVDGFFSRRDSWAVAGLASDAEDEDSRRTIYHEGTHWYLSASDTPRPLWVEEGIAEVFSTFTLEEKQVSWGQALLQHVRWLREVRPIPLRKLTAMTRDDLFQPGQKGENRTGIAYAQSWAFVHFLMFGRTGMDAAALPNFLRLLAAGKDRDEAFQKAFGHTYEQLDVAFARYLAGGSYYVKHQLKVPLLPMVAQPASELEIENALGRLALAGRHESMARGHDDLAIRAGKDDPRPYELAGQIELEAGRKDQAVAAFRRAAERNSRDPQTYFQVAYAEHANAGFQVADMETLAPADARRIADGYEHALNLDAHFLPAYENLAGVLDIADQITSEDRIYLEHGRKLYPDSAFIRLGLAIAAQKSGDQATAERWRQSVLQATPPPSPDARGFAERLETGWHFNRITAQINNLVHDEKFAEALAVVDRELTAKPDTNFQRYLRNSRKEVETMQSVANLNQAIHDEHWSAARLEMNKILASSADEILKSQVRKMLAALPSPTSEH